MEEKAVKRQNYRLDLSEEKPPAKKEEKKPEKIL